MIRSIYWCNFYANRSSRLGEVVIHTYTRKLVYAALSIRDAQYQTCLRQVLISNHQVATNLSSFQSNDIPEIRRLWTIDQ